MSLLKYQDRIFVAGHRGLVGSAIVTNLRQRGYNNLILKTRQELDLLNQAAVDQFFNHEKIDVVFMAAGKVGGILANNRYRADFIYENLQLQNHVIGAAHRFGVRRLVFLGSSCIYPKMAPQPMSELALLSGELEITNRPYALAKIAGIEFVESLRRQHGRDYFSAMPTNLYGPNDNFHPENSHVLPALIDRFWQAKESGQKKVEMWGSGRPLREFMHSADCADAIVFLAENLSFETMAQSTIGRAGWSHVNVGSGQEISIGDLGRLIARLVGYTGEVVFDASKPDGTPRKLLDCSFLKGMGWKPSFTLETGIKDAIDWYATHRQQLR